MQNFHLILLTGLCIENVCCFICKLFNVLFSCYQSFIWYLQALKTKSISFQLAKHHGVKHTRCAFQCDYRISMTKIHVEFRSRSDQPYSFPPPNHLLKQKFSDITEILKTSTLRQLNNVKIALHTHSPPSHTNSMSVISQLFLS